eukprot:350937-Chlamydomonas_euryale.AAC.2
MQICRTQGEWYKSAWKGTAGMEEKIAGVGQQLSDVGHWVRDRRAVVQVKVRDERNVDLQSRACTASSSIRLRRALERRANSASGFNRPCRELKSHACRASGTAGLILCGDGRLDAVQARQASEGGSKVWPC